MPREPVGLKVTPCNQVVPMQAREFYFLLILFFCRCLSAGIHTEGFYRSNDFYTPWKINDPGKNRYNNMSLDPYVAFRSDNENFDKRHRFLPSTPLLLEVGGQSVKPAQASPVIPVLQCRKGSISLQYRLLPEPPETLLSLPVHRFLLPGEKELPQLILSLDQCRLDPHDVLFHAGFSEYAFILRKNLEASTLPDDSSLLSAITAYRWVRCSVTGTFVVQVQVDNQWLNLDESLSAQMQDQIFQDDLDQMFGTNTSGLHGYSTPHNLRLRKLMDSFHQEQEREYKKQEKLPGPVYGSPVKEKQNTRLIPAPVSRPFRYPEISTDKPGGRQAGKHTIDRSTVSSGPGPSPLAGMPGRAAPALHGKRKGSSGACETVERKRHKPVTFDPGGRAEAHSSKLLEKQVCCLILWDEQKRMPTVSEKEISSRTKYIERLKLPFLKQDMTRSVMADIAVRFGRMDSRLQARKTWRKRWE